MKTTIVLGILLIIIIGTGFMINLPGNSYRGTLPPLSPEQLTLKQNVQAHIEELAGKIGPRNITHYQSLIKAQSYIQQQFVTLGYQPKILSYKTGDLDFSNIEIEIPGSSNSKKIIVIGAHYDTVFNSPGADDNTSGVAALIELSRFFKNHPPKHTIRMVAFVNEESPFFMSSKMGSYQYVKYIIKHEIPIAAMISLESLGYYSQAKNSQGYPWFLNFFYPDQANFIGFVSNIHSRHLLYKVLGNFRDIAKFPSEGLIGISLIPGVSWSDQWAFWKNRIPAIMITDTTFYRSPYYHQTTDLPQTIDYDSLTRVVSGLQNVFVDLSL